MSNCSSYDKSQLLALLGLLVLVPISGGQETGPLLRMQRLRAELESQANLMSSGRNVYDSAQKGEQQMDVQKYPNSATCVVVYEDGKYFFEKKEEHTLGKPKSKSAEGVLSADDLQRLKAILDDEALKKIATPKAPDLPPDAQAIKEAERLDVQIGRAATLQQFSLMKERVKTGTTSAISSSASLSGIDTYLDNGEPYKKSLSPLIKWFDELGKKNKLKESKPQYCQ